MTGRVFISYRRADSQESAKSLYDSLSEEIGGELIFFDIDTLHAGIDFRTQLNQALDSCAVGLVVIGGGWIDCDPKTGTPRLWDSRDYVQMEVSEMLNKPNISVIPILLHGTRMPTKRELPLALEELPVRQYIEVKGHDFSRVVSEVTNALERTGVTTPRAERRLVASAVESHFVAHVVLVLVSAALVFPFPSIACLTLGIQTIGSIRFILFARTLNASTVRHTAIGIGIGFLVPAVVFFSMAGCYAANLAPWYVPLIGVIASIVIHIALFSVFAADENLKQYFRGLDWL